MMKAIVLLAALLVCGVIGEQVLQRSDLLRSRSNNKVIGGSPIDIEEWPSIVSLHRGLVSHSHVCGGSILSNRILVSAAHCFEDSIINWSNPARWRVRAGSPRHASGGVYLQLSHVVIHPSYNSNSIDYDIVLLRLSTSLSLSASVAQAVLPPHGGTVEDGTLSKTAGWGATQMGGGSSSVLLAAELQIINQEECHAAYSRWGGVTDRMICAGWPTGGFDACQGDSGGPLTANRILYGIVSWGNGCALAGYPGVNTRVSYFTKWIVEIADSLN